MKGKWFSGESALPECIPEWDGGGEAIWRQLSLCLGRGER